MSDTETQIIRELSDRVVHLEREAGVLAAEIERLQAALREAGDNLHPLKGEWRPSKYYQNVPAALTIIDAALSGKGES